MEFEDCNKFNLPSSNSPNDCDFLFFNDFNDKENLGLDPQELFYKKHHH